MDHFTGVRSSRIAGLNINDVVAAYDIHGVLMRRDRGTSAPPAAASRASGSSSGSGSSYGVQSTASEGPEPQLNPNANLLLALDTACSSKACPTTEQVAQSIRPVAELAWRSLIKRPLPTMASPQFVIGAVAANQSGKSIAVTHAKAQQALVAWLNKDGLSATIGTIHDVHVEYLNEPVGIEVGTDNKLDNLDKVFSKNSFLYCYTSNTIEVSPAVSLNRFQHTTDVLASLEAFTERVSELATQLLHDGEVDLAGCQPATFATFEGPYSNPDNLGFFASSLFALALAELALTEAPLSGLAQCYTATNKLVDHSYSAATAYSLATGLSTADLAEVPWTCTNGQAGNQEPCVLAAQDENPHAQAAAPALDQEDAASETSTSSSEDSDGGASTSVVSRSFSNSSVQLTVERGGQQAISVRSAIAGTPAHHRPWRRHKPGDLLPNHVYHSLMATRAGRLDMKERTEPIKSALWKYNDDHSGAIIAALGRVAAVSRQLAVKACMILQLFAWLGSQRYKLAAHVEPSLTLAEHAAIVQRPKYRSEVAAVLVTAAARTVSLWSLPAATRSATALISEAWPDAASGGLINTKHVTMGTCAAGDDGNVSAFRLTDPQKLLAHVSPAVIKIGPTFNEVKGLALQDGQTRDCAPDTSETGRNEDTCSFTHMRVVRKIATTASMPQALLMSKLDSPDIYSPEGLPCGKVPAWLTTITNTKAGADPPSMATVVLELVGLQAALRSRLNPHSAMPINTDGLVHDSPAPNQGTVHSTLPAKPALRSEKRAVTFGASTVQLFDKFMPVSAVATAPQTILPLTCNPSHLLVDAAGYRQWLLSNRQEWAAARNQGAKPPLRSETVSKVRPGVWQVSPVSKRIVGAGRLGRARFKRPIKEGGLAQAPETALTAAFKRGSQRGCTPEAVAELLSEARATERLLDADNSCSETVWSETARKGLFAPQQSVILATARGMQTASWADKLGKQERPGWPIFSAAELTQLSGLFSHQPSLLTGMIERKQLLNQAAAGWIARLTCLGEHNPAGGWLLGDNWAAWRYPDPGACSGDTRRCFGFAVYVCASRAHEAARCPCPEGWSRQVLADGYLLLREAIVLEPFEITSWLSRPLRDFTLLHQLSQVLQHVPAAACAAFQVCTLAFMHDNRQGQYCSDFLQYCARGSGGPSNIANLASELGPAMNYNLGYSLSVSYGLQLYSSNRVIAGVCLFFMACAKVAGTTKESNRKHNQRATAVAALEEAARGFCGLCFH